MNEPHLVACRGAATMLGMNTASMAARARWARIIAAQRGSGLSIAAFCAGRGIAESSFYPWKRRLAAEGPAFVEARVADGDARTDVRNIGAREDGAGAGMTCRTGVAIELSRGRRVLVSRGFDRMLLLEVIGALESGGTSHAPDASPPDAPRDAGTARGGPS